jgi:hypothetical protein
LLLLVVLFGERILFCFFFVQRLPVSTDSDINGWSSDTGGARLMANALLYESATTILTSLGLKIILASSTNNKIVIVDFFLFSDYKSRTRSHYCCATHDDAKYDCNINTSDNKIDNYGYNNDNDSNGKIASHESDQSRGD